MIPEQSEDTKDEDEDEARKKQLTVEDYTDQEIDQDTNEVDWDFAYSEILRLEERKKDKQTMEADKRLQEEKVRI